MNLNPEKENRINFLKKQEDDASKVSGDPAFRDRKKEFDDELLKLIEHKKTKSELLHTISKTDNDSLREEAWQQLLKQKPNSFELRIIGENVDSLREEAWQEFLKQKPSNDELLYIISAIEPLREKAGQQLLEQKPDSYELHIISENVESLREEADRRLLNLNQDNIKKETTKKTGKETGEEANKKTGDTTKNETNGETNGETGEKTKKDKQDKQDKQEVHEANEQSVEGSVLKLETMQAECLKKVEDILPEERAIFEKYNSGEKLNSEEMKIAKKVKMLHELKMSLALDSLSARMAETNFMDDHEEIFNIRAELLQEMRALKDTLEINIRQAEKRIFEAKAREVGQSEIKRNREGVVSRFVGGLGSKIAGISFSRGKKQGEQTESEPKTEEDSGDGEAGTLPREDKPKSESGFEPEDKTESEEERNKRLEKIEKNELENNSIEEDICRDGLNNIYTDIISINTKVTLENNPEDKDEVKAKLDELSKKLGRVQELIKKKGFEDKDISRYTEKLYNYIKKIEVKVEAYDETKKYKKELERAIENMKDIKGIEPVSDIILKIFPGFYYDKEELLASFGREGKYYKDVVKSCCMKRIRENKSDFMTYHDKNVIDNFYKKVIEIVNKEENKSEPEQNEVEENLKKEEEKFEKELEEIEKKVELILDNNDSMKAKLKGLKRVFRTFNDIKKEIKNSNFHSKELSNNIQTTKAKLEEAIKKTKKERKKEIQKERSNK